MNEEKLKTIGRYILAGMSEKEACVMSDVSYTDFIEAKETGEFIGKYIEKMKVQFKYQHIEQIQRSKSEKNSMYLLEKLRPDEFGPKSRGGEGPTINIISTIIKEIQSDNENNLVKFNRARAIEVESAPAQEGIGLLN